VRGGVPELDTPHPLGRLLPALYQEDDLVQRWCAALDEVMAPALSTLDCFDAYLDPGVTPEDFLEWLAGWVGVALDQNWPEPRRRALVRRAGELYRWQGTVRGIAEHVALYTGVRPEVEDTGGTTWSLIPGDPIPAGGAAAVVVRVRTPDPASVDARHLDAIVAASKPAHVSHRIEVVPSGTGQLA
jgi:phage tail-like protein